MATGKKKLFPCTVLSLCFMLYSVLSLCSSSQVQRCVFFFHFLHFFCHQSATPTCIILLQYASYYRSYLKKTIFGTPENSILARVLQCYSRNERVSRKKFQVFSGIRLRRRCGQINTSTKRKGRRRYHHR